MGRIRPVKATLIGAGGLLLAVGAFMNAMGSVLASAGSPMAVAFDSRNADALAQRATEQVTAAQTDDRKLETLRRTANRALAAGPIQASAMRSVAIATAMEGDPGAALRQLTLAERMSRRDYGTQLALIQACVAASDVPCALRHYDLALSTTPWDEMLTAKLATALAMPEVRQGLASYFHAGRPWTESFLARVANKSPDPTDVADMIVRARGLPGTPLNHESESIILARLAAAGEWEALRRFYDGLAGPGAASALDLSFSPALTEPRRQPVAWRTVRTGLVNASFEPRNGGGLQLRTTAAAGEQGVAASKLSFLPPGRYSLITKVASGGTLPARWRLRCVAGAAPPIGEQPILAEHPNIFDFSIPAGCPAQLLELLAGDPDGDGESQLLITGIILNRAKGDLRS